MKKKLLGLVLVLVLLLVVAVLLAPGLLSGPAKGLVSDGFGSACEGSLEVGEVDLAWFSRQSLGGLVLKDPDGAVVGTASAEVPALWDLVLAGKTNVGLVTLEVNADLVADDGGVTNLQRALAPRGGAQGGSDPQAPSGGGGGEDPFALLADLSMRMEVRADRLSWEDAITRAAGERIEVQDLLVTIDAVPGEPLRLQLDGEIPAEGDPSVSSTVTLAPVAASSAAFDATLDASGLPTGVADIFAGTGGLLAEIVGPRVRFHMEAKGLSADGGSATAEVISDLATVTVTGELFDGAIVSPDGGRSELAFRLTPRSSDSLVGQLMPFVVDLEATNPDQPAILGFSDFTLPLDGDLSRLSGSLDVNLGEVSYTFFPELSKLLKKSARKSKAKTYDLRIDGGTVHYDEMRLRLGGIDATLGGSFAMGSNAVDLRLELPLGALAKKSDLAQKLGDVLGADAAIPLSITGDPLSPSVSLADDFDLGSIDFGDVLEDKAKGELDKLLDDKGLGGLFGGDD